MCACMDILGEIVLMISHELKFLRSFRHILQSVVENAVFKVAEMVLRAFAFQYILRN